LPAVQEWGNPNLVIKLYHASAICQDFFAKKAKIILCLFGSPPGGPYIREGDGTRRRDSDYEAYKASNFNDYVHKVNRYAIIDGLIIRAGKASPLAGRMFKNFA
jgi:hypothetical protein